ncbi:MAG: glycoside hydrolase family 2, partial [Clostridia bacterium]|nr:glycoside hydrolase family 2 [Clostridia bacterium]
MKLTTPWYDSIDKTAPLPEYPRPQLVRESYWNLNGVWEYAIGKKTVMASCPDQMDGEILVPFSPETSLSGVGCQLQPDEAMWYRRTFTLPEGFLKDRLILHFGAVDQHSEVYVNGQLAGESTSGYLPFSMDITELLRDGENLLAVRVEDPSDTSPNCRGKQCLNPKGIWYTAQSGIWQTVWMESVPQIHLTAL